MESLLSFELPFAVAAQGRVVTDPAVLARSPLIRWLGGSAGAIAAATLDAPRRRRTRTIWEVAGNERGGDDAESAQPRARLVRSLTADRADEVQNPGDGMPRVAGDVSAATLDFLIRIPAAAKKRARREATSHEHETTNPTPNVATSCDVGATLVGVIAHTVDFSTVATPCFQLFDEDAADGDGPDVGRHASRGRRPSFGVAPESFEWPFARPVEYRHAAASVPVGIVTPTDVVIDLNEAAPLAPPPVSEQWMGAHVPDSLRAAMKLLFDQQPVWIPSRWEATVISSRTPSPRQDLVHTAIKAVSYAVKRGPFNRLRIRFGFDPHAAASKHAAWKLQRVTYRFPPGIRRTLHTIRKHMRADDGSPHPRKDYPSSLADVLRHVRCESPRDAWFQRNLQWSHGELQRQVVDFLEVLSLETVRDIEQAVAVCQAPCDAKWGWIPERHMKRMVAAVTHELTLWLRERLLPCIVPHFDRPDTRLEIDMMLQSVVAVAPALALRPHGETDTGPKVAAGNPTEASAASSAPPAASSSFSFDDGYDDDVSDGSLSAGDSFRSDEDDDEGMIP